MGPATTPAMSLFVHVRQSMSRPVNAGGRAPLQCAHVVGHQASIDVGRLVIGRISACSCWQSVRADRKAVRADRLSVRSSHHSRSDRVRARSASARLPVRAGCLRCPVPARSSGISDRVVCCRL